uniref:Uncharacterized protein n=1 Tax=Triticum urartu TaxID=4572 RepID=A0A8R7Q0S0_TRIUA
MADAAPPTPSDVVTPTGVGFLIFVSRYSGYGIAQPQAREKFLLGLPMLAAAAPADVVSFLEALSRLSAAPLFELRGNPRSGSSGPDGDDVSAPRSFLKAPSCSFAVSPVLVLEVLVLLLV